MESARQRSRKGCLTCRQRRKKCDEIKPVCGRCKGGDDCIWPASRSASKGAPRPPRLPRIQPRPSLVPKSTTMFVPTETTPMSVSRDDEPNTSSSSSPELDAEYSNIFPETTIGNNSRHLVSYPFVDFGLDTMAPLPELSTSSTPTPSSFGVHRLGWGHKSPPPTSSSLALICIDDEPDHALDEDEEDAFKTAEWLPGTLQLVHLYLYLELPNQNQVQWSSVIESYFTFFIRNSYDPSNFPTHISDLIARHSQLESVRLAVLSTSLLFYSFLNPGLPQVPLRKHAKELIDAAATALWLEELQPDTTPSAQLAGISEIFGFYYYVGDLGSYMRYIEQALPVVQKLVGTAPVSIHKLYGPETLDIRLFAWCDVFSAMATSRPTRLVYDCNVGALLQRNQTGPDTQYLDSGLEWMAGLPDAFLLLTIQILNLNHTPMSSNERITQAATIEAALREWQVWPSGIASSVMRVQRISAQEIWRHSTILYLYQVVHKATPRQEVVQQSVKQIIKLALTLRPGHNPDCLLYIPYFLAGTFAASAKDRRFIRDRLMRCSVDPYMNTLVNALEELWRGTFIDKHNDWTSRSPPLIIF